MRRIQLLAVAFLTPVVLTSLAAHALAQDARSARGTVSAMAADSMTVKVGMTEMKFTVDSKTAVVAPGAGTAARRADAAGAPAPRLADIVKVGNAVLINFSDMGAMHHATRVQVISSAGPGGGSVSMPAKEAAGTVKSVSATSLTVTSDGKDMTFTIDANSDVVARGAGTAAAQRGGKIVITDAVKNGDRVSVTYHEMGAMLHAAEVRVVGATR